MLPSTDQIEAYIRQKAIELGIDPDVAVRVAKSEGLQDGTWQSTYQQPYGREASYGPFQLHVDSTGKRPGLGNQFQYDTGLDPSDPATWRNGVDYALNYADKHGWGSWFGAKRVGITGMDGIGQQAATQPTGAGTSMGGFAMGPGAVQDRMDNGTQMGLLDDSSSWMDTFNTDAMRQIGAKVLDKAKAKKDAAAEAPLPAPVVLQPLHRVTLKGLLG